MSDLGYFSAKQIAPSQSLKQILAKGAWSFCQLEDSVIANVSIPWEFPLDTFGMLNFAKPCWKFFWQSKDSSDRYIALGNLAQIKSQDSETLDRLSKYRVFGSLCFPGLDEENQLWSGFDKDFFILPEVEWAVRSSGTTLSLRVLCPLSFDHKDLIAQASHVYRSYVPATLGKISGTLPQVVSISDTPDQEIWRSMILQATSDIVSDKYKKVVLSRSKQLMLSREIDLGTLLKRLGEIDENSYLFALVEPKGKAFLGRSPERLLSWDEEKVFVDAIAGTRKRAGQRTADRQQGLSLQGSCKDIEEHRFVSDYVRETLSSFCDQVVQQEKEQLLKLKHVQHMRSTFVANRKSEFHSLDLLRSLHPTPAVGGVPWNEATSYIEKFEPFKRGLFAGAIGMLGGGVGDFAIGIRTALIKSNTLILFAGAGIVEGSEPEEEWLETEIKMKNFLELFLNPAGSDEFETH